MSNYVSTSQAPFRLCAANSAFISQMSVSGKSRDLLTAIALALACNRLISIPGNVDSPEEYFAQQGGMDTADAVSLINEIMPVDYKTVLKVALDLFLVRYELSHKPFEAFGIDRKDGLSSVFGLNAHMSRDIIECIRDHGYVITERCERFTHIMQELRKV